METNTPPKIELAHTPAEAEQRRKLKQMKRVATALLVGAAIVFVVARIFEGDTPALGYVRATAEAAMVGAIADWFAVTALFKHPLGLPIPHTAIVPTRKDEIGEGLGQFVQSNFLTAEVVAQKLESVEVSRRIGLWLREPENALKVVAELEIPLGAVMTVLEDDVSSLTDTLLRDRLRRVSIVPIMGRFVDIVAPFVGLDELGAGNGGGEQSSALAARLRSNDRLITQAEELKQDLLDHPEFEAWIRDLWLSVRNGIGSVAEGAESVVNDRLAAAIKVLSDQLLADAELQAKVDSWIESVVISVAEAGGAEIGQLIADTVQGWDADELIDRIEPPVGCDLQFIRINGTLVGGLVGFLIFAVSEWFF